MAFLLTVIIAPVATFGNVFVPNYAVPFPVAPTPTQKTTSPGQSLLSATGFPGTFNDINFADRVEIKRIAYEPFQDMDAYKGLVVDGEEYYTERSLAELEMQRRQDLATMSHQQYCEKYPTDSEECDTDATTLSNIIDIGNAPQPSTTPDLPTTPSYQPTESFTGRTIGGGTVTAKNHIHGGSCYPAAKSKVFTNKVLTTGQYENTLPAFEKAMITVFRKEGKCGIIPGDPCGYTCYGIGSGPNCLGHDIDVRNLTRAGAEKLYHDRIWAKYNYGKLPDVIAGDVFLAGMGSGPCTAIQQFRKFLGFSKNCKIDDDVIRAAENYNGDIHNDWLDVRQKFLVDVAARKYQNRVLKGWMNGIQLKRENGCHVIPADPLYR